MPEHKMINLKQKKKKEREVPDTFLDNPYPYGLELSLDDATLEKLNIGEDIEVGENVSLKALGKVTSISARADEKTKTRSVSIQLTDIGIYEPTDEDMPQKSLADHAETLFAPESP